MDVRRMKRGVAGGALVALVLAACSGGDGDSGDTSATTPSPTVAAPSTGDAEPNPERDESADTNPPLGFAVDTFDVSATVAPISADPDSDVSQEVVAESDVDQLIDNGVQSEAWTEVEAVRAIVSVLMGEALPDLVPGLDELPHPSIGNLIERAERLLGDDTVDAEQQADLARLTAFFFVGRGIESLGAPNDTEGLRRTGRSGLLRQSSGCTVGRTAQPTESQYGALTTSDTRAGAVSYCVLEEDGNRVYFPEVYDFGDDPRVALFASERVFELIELARVGYLDLAATELPAVDVLITPRIAPGSEALAHVVSNTSSRCNVAIFLSLDFLDQGLAFDEMVAHELFHCIQREWPGSMEEFDPFVREGGASYFAGRLLQKCLPVNDSYTNFFDRWTATNSLLDTSYSSWLFWDYLEQNKDYSPVAIAAMHRAGKAGRASADVLAESVGGLSQTLNELYVRLMGPGLSMCQTTGSTYTGEVDVEDAGELSFANVAWTGSRYLVNYPERVYVAQQRGDGEPIGMVEEPQRGDKDSWVLIEPEIRTTCSDEKQWVLVVANHTAESSGAPSDRIVQVLEHQEARCDPCPVGSWQTTEESLKRLFESIGQGATIEIEGGWRLTFAGSRDGEPTVVTEDSDVVFIASTAGGSLPVSVDSTGSGEWTGNEADLGLVGYGSTGTASLFSVSGTSSSTVTTSLPYTCEGDDMSATVQGQTLEFVRLDTQEGEPYFGEK